MKQMNNVRRRDTRMSLNSNKPRIQTEKHKEDYKTEGFLRLQQWLMLLKANL